MDASSYFSCVVEALVLLQDINRQVEAFRLLNGLHHAGNLPQALLAVIDEGGDLSLAAARQLQGCLSVTPPDCLASLFWASISIISNVYWHGAPDLASAVARVSAIFVERDGHLLFPDLPSTLIRLVQSPPRELAGLLVARQYADHDVDLSAAFASELTSHFGSHPLLVLEIASRIARKFCGYISEGFVASLVESSPFESVDASRYTLQLVGRVLKACRRPDFVDFIVWHIRSGPEWAVYEAARLMKKRHLAEFQPAAAAALLEQIGLEDGSRHCLGILQRFVDGCPQELVPPLAQFVGLNLADGELAGAALRTLSVIQQYISNPGELVAAVLPLIRGAHCVDAARCIVGIARMGVADAPRFPEEAAAHVFDALDAAPSTESRREIAQLLAELAHVAVWQPQPLVANLLRWIRAAEDVMEQQAVWNALATFCQRIERFEANGIFEKLFEATVRAFVQTLFRAYAYDVFASMAGSAAFCVGRILEVVAEAIMQALEDDSSEFEDVVRVAQGIARGAAAVGVDCSAFLEAVLICIQRYFAEDVDPKLGTVAWRYVVALVETGNRAGVEWAVEWLRANREGDAISLAGRREALVRAIARGDADPLSREEWIDCVAMLWHGIEREDAGEQVEIVMGIADALARIRQPKLPADVLARLVSIVEGLDRGKLRDELTAAFARVSV
jgi:hypothetical protein